MSEKAFDMKTKEIDDVIDLIDPFEGQVIGKFWHTTKTATKVKEQNLVMCFVEFPAESKDCNSRHDFDKLAKEYMAN